MAQAPNLRRNLEAGQIYIPLWVNGIHVNRSPLFTPISAMGTQIISRFDTLWGGNNMELSMQNTLVRRPGYSKWCTSAFGASEWPLQFYSYQNLSGSITTLVDTQTNTYSFTPTSKTSIVSKVGGAVQTAFQRIGQALYMANGKGFQATGDAGIIGTARPVGIAVPAVAPSFVLGTNGSLLPTTGFTYGYSYANSVSGHVSTMSPLSANVGDLNVQEVTEGTVSCSISLVTSVTPGSGSGTVTFTTPNGNNFSVGQTVRVSGFPVTTAGTWVVNNNYVITACAAGYFSASTAVWGPDYHGTSGYGFGQNCSFVRSTIGCYGTLNPITIPGTGGPGANYVYTVVNTSNFSSTNLFGAVTPSPVSVKSPGGTTVYTQIASGTPTTGQFVVSAAGAFTFAAADTGKSIVIKYAVTPTTGATPVSIILTGPSTDNAFGVPTAGANGVGSNGQQTDTTGFTNVDSIIIYRDQDTDLAAGPWYFLAEIPNNLAITQATVLAQSNQVVYTLANPCKASNNNGFAGASGTGGATIAGFSNSGNNGRFDIVASTSNTITCTNSGGVNETHAATVNSGTWNYTDTGSVYGYVFNETVPDGELDILIEAPINDENNPPPTGVVLPNPAIRDSQIQASIGNTYTFTWSGSTAVGDLAIIAGGHVYVINPPAGWTTGNQTGLQSFISGAVFYKVLTSADIALGHVQFTTSNPQNGVFAMTVIKAGTFTGIREIDVVRNSSGSSSVPVTTASPVASNDLLLYFGANTTTSNNTVDQGSQLQQLNSSWSGCLYAGAPTPSSSLTATFSYSSAGTGNYETIIAVTAQPNTFSLLCFGAGRMWGAVDNYVYFAGGPDVTFGNGNESWPPANVFTFPGKVTALSSVPAGIIVFTADDMYIIYGTSTATFYPQVYQKNFGVASQNSLVLDGDTLYIYSNSSQLWSFTDRLIEVGINVAPYLDSFAPPSVYLTMHKNGHDVGLFISDGSTNYLRYRIDEGAWSPQCQIVGGARCFQSIETAPGVYTLMVGSAAGSGYIAARDLTTFTDIGGTFTCNVIVGSLIVSPPGSTALVDYINVQYVNVGSDPTVSFLPQDYAPISGSVSGFTALSLVNDPPKLIANPAAQFKQKRAYLKSAATPIAQEMSNLQVNVAFPAENFKAELLTMGVT